MAKWLIVFFLTVIAPAVVISKTFLDENGHPHECSVCPDNQIIRSPCSAFKDTVCGSLYVHDFKEPSNDRFLDEIQEAAKRKSDDIIPTEQPVEQPVPFIGKNTLLVFMQTVTSSYRCGRARAVNTWTVANCTLPKKRWQSLRSGNAICLLGTGSIRCFF